MRSFQFAHKVLTEVDHRRSVVENRQDEAFVQHYKMPLLCLPTSCNLQDISCLDTTMEDRVDMLREVELCVKDDIQSNIVSLQFHWCNVHYCGWFAQCNGFLLWSCLLAESYETTNHCPFVRHLLTNNLTFEHGGGKLVFCLRRHLTLLRPCAMHITIV